MSSFLSLFIYFLFIRSFFLSVFPFTFSSIFLAPASKLFLVTWVNKLHLHFTFYTVRFGVPGVFGVPVFRGVPGCSGVPGFSGVPGCSGVPVFRRVPVFLVLVHARFMPGLFNAP